MKDLSDYTPKVGQIIADEARMKKHLVNSSSLGGSCGWRSNAAGQYFRLDTGLVSPVSLATSFL